MKKSHLLLVILILLLANNCFFAQTPTLEILGNLKESVSQYPITYYGSAVYGNYLYTAGDGTVFIYNTSDPENPSYISKLSGLSNISNIWSGDSKLYLYNGTTKNILIYDITDPTNPTFLSSFLAGIDLHKVASRGNYLYVLYLYEYENGKAGSLEIYDISDPTNPNLVKTYLPETIEGRDFIFSDDGNKLYVAYYKFAPKGGIIKELDISNPANPTELRTLNITNAPINIGLINNTLIAYCDNGWQGPSYLEAYNLSSESPEQLASIQVGSGRGWNLHVYNNTVLVSLLQSGLKDYTWNSVTNSFTLNSEASASNASHLSYIVSDQTALQESRYSARAENGRWVTIVYFVLEKSPTSLDSEQEGHVLKKVKKRIWIPGQGENVLLTMNITPSKAITDGCETSPAVGGHVYEKDEEVDLQAKEADGWAFLQWIGASGSKSTSITMTEDKEVTAEFAPILTVSGSGVNEIHCPSDVEGKPVQIGAVTFCASKADGWKILKIDLSLNFVPEIITKIYVNDSKANTLATAIINAPIDRYLLTLSTPLEVPASTCQSVYILYEFISSKELLEAQQTKPLGYHTNSITASPINYPPGKIEGKGEANDLYVAKVKNTTKNLPFDTITDAIENYQTKDGDVIDICDCEFEEKVDVKKELTLNGHPDGSKVKYNVEPAKSLIEINKNNTTINNLILEKITSTATLTTRDESYHGNAIKAYGSWNDSLQNLSITNNKIEQSFNKGIYLYKVIASRVSTNDIENCERPIRVEESNKITVSKNTISNTKYGNTFINFQDTKHSTISENGGNNGMYITLTNSTRNTISANHYPTGASGISLIELTERSDYNSIMEHKEFSIKVSEAYGTEIENNELRSIELLGSISGKIIDNTIKEGIIGISLIKGEQYSAFNTIENNKIYLCFKEGIYGLYSVADVIKNNKIYRNGTSTSYVRSGIYLQECDGMKFIDNKILNNARHGIELDACNEIIIRNNDINSHSSYSEGVGGEKAKGVYAYNSSVIKIESNNFIKNCTGIKLKWCKKSKIGFNNIMDSFCFFTGINLDGSNPLITGNVIANNGGNGIYAENNSFPSITNNEIHGNSDAGVNNGNSSGTIDASGNYWGNSDGPSGNDLIGNIDCKNWIDNELDIVASFINDTLFCLPGQVDSNTFIIRNFQNPTETFSVSVIEGNEFISGESSFSSLQADSVGTYTDFSVLVPVEFQEQAIKIKVRSTAIGNQYFSKIDSFYVLCYTPEYNFTTITPDSSFLVYPNRLQFSAKAFDQFNNEMNYQYTWSSSSGSIDSTGLFKPDSINGEAVITAIDTLHNISKSAIVFISAQPLHLTQIKISPDSVSLKPGSSQQFEVTSIDQFGNQFTIVPIWSATGGSITQDGLFTADSSDGNFFVTVTDSSGIVSDTAYISINHLLYLASITISPDSVYLYPGETQKFEYNSFDQDGNKFAIQPVWAASGGSISQAGLFTADSIDGNYFVTVTDSTGLATDTACVFICYRPYLASIIISPDSATLLPSESQKFEFVGLDQNAISFVFAPVWSATGGTITKDGVYTADSSSGIFEVTITDSLNSASATAYIEIESILDVANSLSAIPDKYELKQNYPNPFNPTTTITYALPFNSMVNLEIYNLIGQRITQLVNRNESAGYKSVIWNASNISSGIYFMRLSAKSLENSSNIFIDYKKLLLLK